MLFALKLELFEYDVIKKSDNAKYKSLIRNTQSPYEIMKYAIEIIEYENQKKNTTKKLKRLEGVNPKGYAQPISPIKKEKPDIGKMLDSNIKKNSPFFCSQPFIHMYIPTYG